MKVRKAPFALLLIFTFISLAWVGKAKVIATVTNEENIISNQSTRFIIGESKDGYILLNKPKDKEKKEYLNAYFTYNENGLYVDGTDAVPLELLINQDGYISVGFDYSQIDYGQYDYGQSNQDQPGQDQSDQDQSGQDRSDQDQSGLWQVIDLGSIKMSMTEDPIFWRAVTDKGVYQMSAKELEDSAYIRELLPQTLENIKGYMMVQGDMSKTLSGKIDLVPFDQNSVERILGIKDSIKADTLKYNSKLYQYLQDSSKGYSELVVTANYHFKIALLNNKYIEGKITFTKNYQITK
ncbi:MAG: hypothetical protein K0S61_851 [Anaerocolumna sp.]|jgi:hypothetical protein|nr:hypothetical protein [Anaerocolumna sp.]